MTKFQIPIVWGWEVVDPTFDAESPWHSGQQQPPPPLPIQKLWVSGRFGLSMWSLVQPFWDAGRYQAKVRFSLELFPSSHNYYYRPHTKYEGRYCFHGCLSVHISEVSPYGQQGRYLGAVGTGWGYPLFGLDREIGRLSRYAGGGMPLALMQEDFLVFKLIWTWAF